MINCEESLRFPACLQNWGAGPDWRLPRWCRVWSEEHPGGAVLGSLSLQQARGGNCCPPHSPHRDSTAGPFSERAAKGQGATIAS